MPYTHKGDLANSFHSFDVHEAINRTWGVERNGAFNGVIGLLQREEMDFSTIAAPTAKRLKAVTFIMAYPSDTFAIASLKPTLLPKYLALIRPFKGEVWVAVMVSVVVWGVTLWLLQQVWQWVVGGERRVDLVTSLLYGYGALLQNLPSDPTVSTSGRMLVGWWLMFCLIITTGFSSSLMAHLTVQRKARPMDSFQDLVKQPGWKWGTDPWMRTEAVLDYFNTNPSPVVKHIFLEMKVVI
ncbi:glutamate receptor ionotropic, delta-1-like [Procambarus clarkii]|uniref:glutamate receptor ionotropic, delta-1-like n=1 Tax=Procambarus clarkii TaxID=6728 RepID=UPI003742476D